MASFAGAPAYAALTFSFFVDVSVRFVKWMAIFAMGFGGVDLPKCTYRILRRVNLMRHVPEMIDIATVFDHALMIDFQSLWNRPVFLFPNINVYTHHLALNANGSIASAMASSKAVAWAFQVLSRAWHFVVLYSRRRSIWSLGGIYGE